MPLNWATNLNHRHQSGPLSRRFLLPLIVAAALCLNVFVAARAGTSQRAQGTRRDAKFMIYIPDGLSPDKKYPWLLGLTPNGKGERALGFMQNACDTYHWILIVPEAHGTVLPWLALDPMMNDIIDTCIKNYPVDPGKLFTAGFAGGAMEAHHLSVLCPDKVQGVIANCGIIHGAGLQDPDYPKSKLAVFLASPTDGRYMQMKENAQFLQGRNWTTTWVEFPGGHNWAPQQYYSKAVGWLDQHADGR